MPSWPLTTARPFTDASLGCRTLTFAFLVGFGLVPAIHWCVIAPHKVRGVTGAVGCVTYALRMTRRYGTLTSHCYMCTGQVRMMFIDNLAGMFAAYGLGFTFWHTRFPEVREEGGRSGEAGEEGEGGVGGGGGGGGGRRTRGRSRRGEGTCWVVRGARGARDTT